ncbi:2-oxoglutarate-dependent dioxygenase citB [Cladobotryum mycophilum]|uniref:2-oxoglutarate-dependent dioxygenase citB n=1 Tax=Cladobotryum mycophilum TaxID=491253 RepID=A0ABR0SMW4_9HYPO
MASPIVPGEVLIPTIDIEPFLSDPTSIEAQNVIDAVRQACQKTGFFQIVGHGISEDVQQRLLAASRKFFALKQEEKNKLDATTKIGRRGYDVLGAETLDNRILPDLKEGFWIGPEVPLDDPKVKDGRLFMGPNVWPDENLLPREAFRDHAEEYYEAIRSLALTMLKIVEQTLPHGAGMFDGFTDDHAVAVLRLLHYPPMPHKDSLKGKKQLGAGEHTDFGAITLLLQDENSGLEVLDPDTKEFIPVDPAPNTFVFNVGDMLSLFTGGEYRSSIHRVINKAQKDRYSVAFFYNGEVDFPLIPLSQRGVADKGEDILTVEKHLLKRTADAYEKSHKD